jgi:hypothetical protein
VRIFNRGQRTGHKQEKMCDSKKWRRRETNKENVNAIFGQGIRPPSKKKTRERERAKVAL